MSAAGETSRNRDSSTNVEKGYGKIRHLSLWSDSIMLGTDENKPAGKSGQRKRKAKQQKTEQETRKAVEQQIPAPEQLQNPDPLQDAPEPVSEPILANGTSAAETPAETVAEIVVDIPPVRALVPAEVVSVSVQSIANAYGDYSKKSLEQARFFFERLAGVRSLDKAFELQTDFFRQACETLISDSQKICELHKDLAKQNLKRLETWSGWSASWSR